MTINDCIVHVMWEKRIKVVTCKSTDIFREAIYLKTGDRPDTVKNLFPSVRKDSRFETRKKVTGQPVMRVLKNEIFTANEEDVILFPASLIKSLEGSGLSKKQEVIDEVLSGRLNWFKNHHQNMRCFGESKYHQLCEYLHIQPIDFRNRYELIYAGPRTYQRVLRELDLLTKDDIISAVLDGRLHYKKLKGVTYSSYFELCRWLDVAPPVIGNEEYINQVTENLALFNLKVISA